MPKINFSYETYEELYRFMNLIAPVLHHAKIREKPKKNKYHHVYITYENQSKKRE